MAYEELKKHGITSETPENLMLGAGIICHNDDPEELASCIGQVIRGLSGMDDMRSSWMRDA